MACRHAYLVRTDRGIFSRRRPPSHSTESWTTTMTHSRLLGRLGSALAVGVAVVSGLGIATLPGHAGAVASFGTPLPAGWELCILAGVTAPATQANVANLDAWQQAEGGSTNNTAAYNPFNTLRTTDNAGKPVPAITSSNGFPAYANWQGGCTATVATLDQPNMTSIVAALQAGDVAPPGAFLAAVDESQWCAPSADGMPCYFSHIVNAAGEVAGLVTHSSALAVFGNVKGDLAAYEKSVAAQQFEQMVLTVRNEQLTEAQSQASQAEQSYLAVRESLRKFAVDEYMSSGLFEASSFFNDIVGTNPFQAHNEDNVTSQQYQGVIAKDLVARFDAAAATSKASIDRREAAGKAVTEAASTLASENQNETHALSKLVADVATLEIAGACTTVTLTATSSTAPATTATADSSGSPTTTTTSSTTTTTVPAPSPTASTTTTSTTTLSLPTLPPLSTTTTSSTTTTTTTPPGDSSTTTTTTTTVPDSNQNAAPQTADPAQLTALQGCVSALNPTGSA
jgi:hypothetical protein